MRHSGARHRREPGIQAIGVGSMESGHAAARPLAAYAARPGMTPCNRRSAGRYPGAMLKRFLILSFIVLAAAPARAAEAGPAP